MKSGNFSDAIDIYSKILEIQPNDEQALLNRAIAYTHAEEWEIKPVNVGMSLITHHGHRAALSSSSFIKYSRRQI